MEFPTHQPEIDSIILLNLDEETLINWLLDSEYVRTIFKAKIDDFMKEYVEYGNVIAYSYGNVTKEEKYFLLQDDEEALAGFAASLMEQPQLVKIIINYLNEKNIDSYFYHSLFYKFIADKINYPIIEVTTEDFKLFFSLAPNNNDLRILNIFVEDIMNSWPLKAFIPLFESMILAAGDKEDILEVLRDIWRKYGYGYGEEALGYFDIDGDKPRNEDYIMLVKYIYRLLGMEKKMLFDFGEAI